MSESKETKSGPAVKEPKDEARNVSVKVITFAFKYRGAVYVPNNGQKAVCLMTASDAKKFAASGDVQILN